MLHNDLYNYEEGSHCVFVSDGVKITALGKTEAWNLAKVIQRDYIVRPRDNDGITYHKGDKVWSIDSDTECSAVVTNVSESSIEIKWEGDTCCYWGDPCDMTHKRPDSIDTVINDMKFYKTTKAFSVEDREAIGDWISRIENLRDSGHC